MATSNSTPVRSYEITGRGDGHLYGIYPGETKEDAVRALLADAGCDEAPDMDAWYVVEVEATGTPTVAHLIAATSRSLEWYEAGDLPGALEALDGFRTLLVEVEADEGPDMDIRCVEETPEAAVRTLLVEVERKGPPDLVEALATLCERDEAGRHFTETCGCLDELEAAGWIEIDRPIHEATGISYSQEYWHLTVTDAGIEAVEAAGY